ncbi:MAG TPA: hypothetical protein VGI27_10590 [Solirubrobacteraceae bacterium]
MTSDSADQTPSEHDAAASGPAPHEGEPERREPEQRERYGPLSLLRTRKGDGRALLLFSHAAEEHER